MHEAPAYPRIPYGEGDFRRIRLNRWLYFDKTRFLRRLERQVPGVRFVGLAVVFYGWEMAYCDAVE